MAYIKTQSRDKFLQAIKLGAITDYKVFGWGAPEVSIEYETEEETTRWVVQKAGATRNKGYTLSSSVDIVVLTDDPLFKEFDIIRRGLLTGEKAMGKLLNVNLYDSDEEAPKSVSGEEFDIQVSINTFGGASEDDLGLSLTINYQGAPTLGQVAITYGEDEPTFAFTKDVVGG